MNSGDIMLNIKNIKDLDKINEKTKYINISIDSSDIEAIDYLLLNGNKYLYSESINDKKGFIYTSYENFKTGESLINNIIDKMPNNLNELEQVRYLYITLGKILSIDINNIDEKNETISFSNISNINNIWTALSNKKINDKIISKIFMYICSRLNIKSELIISNLKGNIANKIYINNTFIIVDLFNDIQNIQVGFKTKYFDNYNDNKDIDKKINYIKEEYTDFYIENNLKNIDYTKEDILHQLLSITSNIFNINNIGTYELYRIYKELFNKYIPNYDIKINNLFINSSNLKNHFTIFSYNENYYSFNYEKGYFININKEIIFNNIKNKIIGVYENEDFELKENGVTL